jgi:hypothetical protein
MRGGGVAVHALLFFVMSVSPSIQGQSQTIEPDQAMPFALLTLKFFVSVHSLLYKLPLITEE